MLFILNLIQLTTTGFLHVLIQDFGSNDGFEIHHFITFSFVLNFIISP